MGFGAAALVTSVLVVGGALRWTQAVVATLVAASLTLQLLSRRRLGRLSPLVLLPALAAGLTLVQLLPLPPAVLELLDGTSVHLRDEGAAIAGTAPWRCISLDPAGSLRAVAFYLTLLGVALVSLRFATTERGRFLLLGAVATTCGLAAVVTGLHSLLNADLLYGLYEPSHAFGAPVMGPLLNPNHMGGLMAIGAVLSLGLAFYPHQVTQLRVLWIVIGLACVCIAAASLSRGAMIGMVIGMVATGMVLLAGRGTRAGHRDRALWRDLPVAIVVGLGLAAALYVSAGNVVDQIGDTSLGEMNRPVSKYAAWKSSVALVKESPVLGVGRGAVEPSLTRVFPSSAYYTFSHLENEYVTAVVDWGVLGGALLAAVLGWAIVVALRRWRDGALAAASLGALAMIMFQSSVDFGIEMLGIAVPVTIIASTVQLVPLRPAATMVGVRFVRLALIVALLSAAGVLLRPESRSIQEDHDALLALEHPTLTDITPVIARHPLDYFPFGLAADAASRDGDARAASYLNQALALHPTHPGLHRLAARMLVGLKRYPQAALEYSLAMNAAGAPRRLLDEIVVLIPDADNIALAIPTDYPNFDRMLHSLNDLKRSDIAQKWLARIAEQPQHNQQVIDMLYDMAMSRKDFAAAKSAAVLRLSVSHTTTSRLMVARARFELKEYAALQDELGDVEKWKGGGVRRDEKSAAWLISCDVHIALEAWDPALECIHRLDASGLLTSRADVTKRLAAINDARLHEAKMQAIDNMNKSLAKPSPSTAPAVLPPIAGPTPAPTPAPDLAPRR